jgi:hypothetical protein
VHRAPHGNRCCSTEFWSGWGKQTGTVAGSADARETARAARWLETARPAISQQRPIPKAGPLAEPKSVDQIGFPAELTRQAIPPDNPQTPDKTALGETLFFSTAAYRPTEP